MSTTDEGFMFRTLTEETTTHVLTESTRVAIEKIAVRAAEEMLADPEFAAQLRAEVKRAVGRLFERSGVRS